VAQQRARGEHNQQRRGAAQPLPARDAQGLRHCQRQHQHAGQQGVTPPAEVIAGHFGGECNQQPRQRSRAPIPGAGFHQAVSGEGDPCRKDLPEPEQGLRRRITAERGNQRRRAVDSVMIIERTGQIGFERAAQTAGFYHLADNQAVVQGIDPGRQCQPPRLPQAPNA